MNKANVFVRFVALAAASTIASSIASMAAHAQTDGRDLRLTDSVCTSQELAAPISPDRIGEPVSAIVLDSLTWVSASGTTPAHCMVNGRLLPVDDSPTARPIRF